MLSLAEYNAYAADIDALGETTDKQIADAIQDDTNPNTPQQVNLSKQSAIKAAKSFVVPYQGALQQIMNQAMWAVAQNAYHHYSTATDKPIKDTIVKEVVTDQYRQKYYGLNLNQRIVLLRLRLNRIMTQTAQGSVKDLGGTFTEPVPFGAQSNVSKRLLQGTSIKIEQDIARKIAKEANYPFIRWTLAKQHIRQCQCEVYAANKDKKVKDYLREHSLDIDPVGLFFTDTLPFPPHPNCQCEFDLVDDQGREEIIPSHGRRIVSKIKDLVHKILRVDQ